MKLNSFEQKITEEEYKELKNKQFNSNVISNCVLFGLLVLWLVFSIVIIVIDSTSTLTKIIAPIETLLIVIFIRLLQVIFTKQRRETIKEYEEIQDIQCRAKIEETTKQNLGKNN